MLDIHHLVYAVEDWRCRYDLQLPRGTFCAIIGPSGGGKSTLLNLLGGFLEATSGHIRFEGEDITALPPWRRPVTMLFQEHNLFAHLTVMQNIGLGLDPGLKLDAGQKARIDEALAAVGLKGYGARQPGSLSGGQRQRAALARALVRRKPLLLLDEPFAALDPGLRLDMLDLIRRLHEEFDLTVLLVSHAPEEAARYASDIAFVAGGKVAARPRPDELRAGHVPESLKTYMDGHRSHGRHPAGE
jgi:thiamine transport system ATP-binding protein